MATVTVQNVDELVRPLLKEYCDWMQTPQLYLPVQEGLARAAVRTVAGLLSKESSAEPATPELLFKPLLRLIAALEMLSKHSVDPKEWAKAIGSAKWAVYNVRKMNKSAGLNETAFHIVRAELVRSLHGTKIMSDQPPSDGDAEPLKNTVTSKLTALVALCVLAQEFRGNQDDKEIVGFKTMCNYCYDALPSVDAPERDKIREVRL